MAIAPIFAEWTGDSFAPLARFKKQCDASLVIGERYKIEIVEERSAVSHAHYFAQLHEYWLSLPESIADQYASVEHLRKKALIACGYADERSIACASKAEAQRVAAFINPMDGYAVVTVREAVVRVYTAQSQSLRSMGKSEFQKSKESILEYISALIGAKLPKEDHAA